jgi:hypothetical protein
MKHTFSFKGVICECGTFFKKNNVKEKNDLSLQVNSFDIGGKPVICGCKFKR